MKKSILIIPLIILLFTGIATAEKLTTVSITTFNGLCDKIPEWSEKYPAFHSPYIQNVKLDYGTIRKREGYTIFNSTSLGNYSVRNLHNYYDVDTNVSYCFAVCGSSIMYSTGGTAFSVLFTTVSATRDIICVNYGAKCYIFNINRSDATMLIVDGVTVTKTLSMPAGIVTDALLYREKLFASIDSYIYASDTYNPDDWDDTNGNDRYYEVNTNDGQIIKAMSIAGDSFYIFKTHSMFLGQFPSGGYLDDALNISELTSAIGTLYRKTVKKNKGGLWWFGNSLSMPAGVYMTDGSAYPKNITENIPNFVADIDQSNASTFSFEDTSGADFGAGTSLGVDTTTLSGSLLTRTTMAWNRDFTPYGLFNYQCSQSFIPKYDSVCNKIDVYLIKVGTGAAHTVWLREGSNAGKIISTATFSASNVNTTASWVSLNFSPKVSLLTSTSYFIYFSKGGKASSDYPPTTGSYIGWGLVNYNSYLNGKAYYDGELPVNDDFSFKQYEVDLTTFTSQVHDLYSPVAFGNIEISDTDPDSITTYQIATSTWDGGYNTWTTVTHNNIPSVSAYRYCEWRSIFNKSYSTQTASVQSFKINWIDTRTGYQDLIAEVENNNYWLGYEVVGSTFNNSVLYCDEYNNLIPFTNMHFLSFLSWNGKFYGGSSYNDGYIYELNKADVYTDNGTGINAYYRTQTYNFQPTDYFYNIRYFGGEFRGSSTNFSIDLTRRHNYDILKSSTQAVNMYSTKDIITKRHWIREDIPSKYFDLQIEDTSSYFWECSRLEYFLKLGKERLWE